MYYEVSKEEDYRSFMNKVVNAVGHAFTRINSMQPTVVVYAYNKKTSQHDSLLMVPKNTRDLTDAEPHEVDQIIAKLLLEMIEEDWIPIFFCFAAETRVRIPHREASYEELVKEWDKMKVIDAVTFTFETDDADDLEIHNYEVVGSGSYRTNEMGKLVQKSGLRELRDSRYSKKDPSVHLSSGASAEGRFVGMYRRALQLLRS